MRKMHTIVLLLFSLVMRGQVKIHAHNDYEKPLPLMNALANKVFSVEADVFLRNNSLPVAHNASDIDPQKTLSSLYIEPIAALFKKFGGRISEDPQYKLTLMIDIKQGGEQTIHQIVREMKPYQQCFDRSVNPLAVQVVISGDRGNIKNWKDFPEFIFFDGRPNETYDTPTLKRVALVSDGYSSYVDNSQKLKMVLEQAHQSGMLFRFWGTPDNEVSWKYFRESGVDIINTDKPELCRKFFETSKSSR